MSTGRGITLIEVYLSTLEHPDLAGLTGEVDGVTMDGKLRFANWRQVFTSRSDQFASGFFKITRPKLGDRKGQIALSVDNVDQRIRKAVRALTGRPTLTLEVVYAHAPDTVVRSWAGLEALSFTVDRRKIKGTFGPPQREGAFMGVKLSPAGFPGAFS